MVEHRNVANFFTGMDGRIGAEPGVWLAVTSLSFDISVLELFWTLARGFKVVLTSGRKPHVWCLRRPDCLGAEDGLFDLLLGQRRRRKGRRNTNCC